MKQVFLTTLLLGLGGGALAGNQPQSGLPQVPGQAAPSVPAPGQAHPGTPGARQVPRAPRAPAPGTRCAPSPTGRAAPAPRPGQAGAVPGVPLPPAEFDRKSGQLLEDRGPPARLGPRP